MRVRAPLSADDRSPNGSAASTRILASGTTCRTATTACRTSCVISALVSAATSLEFTPAATCHVGSTGAYRITTSRTNR